MDPTESPPETQPSSLPADGGGTPPDVDMEEIEGGDGEEELNDNEEEEEEEEEDEEYEEEEEEDDVEEEDEEEEEDEGDEIIAKANALMDKITSNVDNPNPIVLHALASLLETEESRYKEEHISDSNNDRSPHNIGRLGSLLQENDEFFELISSTFLSESRYVESVQAAAARLLFSCSLTWTYPHVFDDGVLENIKRWAIDETFRSSSSNHNKHGSHEPGRKKSPDMEMLRTYSTGLLAVCLAGGGQVVDDVLTSGLAAKELMQYLRVRVLGEAPNNQKDTSSLTEAKNAPLNASSRSRDESRARLRQVPESSHLEPPRLTDDGFIDVQVAERDRSIVRQTHADGRWDGEEFPDTSIHLDHLEVETDGAEKIHVRDLCSIKGKSVGKSPREEFDEPLREDSARRRVHLGWGKSRGKSRVADGLLENDQAMSSPSSGVRLGGKDNVIKERSPLKNQDPRKTHDVKKSSFSTGPNGISMERDDNDDCFQDCKIGSRDITDLVKKAIRAAEGEARAANGPAEAIKAGGDAAAELVKSAALEEYRKTNDEDASVLAASNAASTVVDAANAVELLRNSAGSDGDSKVAEPETSENVEEFFVLDSDSLAQLREKFCIQCLIILGEYVEVLKPVLREKGVDVCLALLQRSSKHKGTSKVSLILSDVLKLINALAAHRKFAEIFVDRGGIQKLLAAPRVAKTFLGLSSCLLVIGSIQGIMERVCALPPSIVQQVVELALELLACPQDQPRKNAALFFGAAFVFRAVLDAFDSRDGLQKMLSLLHDAASVRSGGSSGSLPGSGSRNDRSPAEVLTSSEKQIAYQTCVALRQYFRAHLILLVDSVRPNKGTRSAAGNIPHSRAAYKPIDISNEAMDSIFRQIQKERKLGLALVRARWSVVDKFISSNGHVTMLELCQAPPVERYLHDLLQYALGVLHIVTLVPYTRKLIVNATVSNGRVGIAIILDAVSGVGNVEPEIIQASLSVLINLVCPPPSISNKPPAVTQEQQTVSNIPLLENRDINTERGASERVTSLTTQNESRERNGDPTLADRSSSAATSSTLVNSSQTSASVSTVGSGLVGDRRISLGARAGCAGLAAQLEQGYHQAREAVRANYGIKILLQLLQPRIVTPSGSLDCLRALACRVLLGLARDDTIAHILTKLQVGKKLSELIRDSGSTQGNEQNRWQTELVKVAIELIGVVTNSGRTNALAATDAATPALRRIERAAIAAATPITYHSRELLLLIHEHLQAFGMANSASLLLKEAQLMPLPSLAAPSLSAQQAYVQETFPVQIQWPSGRIPLGFMSDKINTAARYGDSHFRCDIARSHWKKKILALPSARGSHLKAQPPVEDSKVSCWSRSSTNVKRSPALSLALESPSVSAIKTCEDMDVQTRTSVVLPMKRKLMESNDTTGLVSSVKRINTGESPDCTTPVTARRSGLSTDQHLFSTPGILKDQQGRFLQGGTMAADADDGNCSSAQRGHMTPSAQHGLLSDSQPLGTERLTLDSIVVQYLKQQHRQCSAPITTLPPLSLLHPHVCPEPHRSLDAPPNVTARLSTREFKNKYGGLYGSRKDRQFVYSRFRPWRTCRDDAGALITCISFLGDSPQIALGSHTGELKIFDSSSNSVVENYTDHQSPVTMLQSYFSGETQLVLSSTSHDVKLWDSASISAGPRHSFDGRKAARFSNSSTLFAALSSDLSHREVHLYDIQTCQLDVKLTDSASSTPLRGHMHSHVHFSPSDAMVLWDGVLWDRRVSGPIHHFDQFTDYGGGGFHPAGNEVIINSEVWDLRNFRLLRSVPSLDQTLITFNASGNVMYAILRRNLEDVMSAFQTRRVKHPLFAAFRTVDAVTYSDIATIPVDRCVLDFATEPTDSFVGLVTMDDQDEMYSSSRLYEIGRRKPTDDDSDPDNGETDDDEDDEEDDIDEDPMVESDFEGESDGDDMSNDEDIFSELEDDDEDDGDFLIDGGGFDGGGIFEFEADDEVEDDSEVVSFSSGDDEEELM